MTFNKVIPLRVQKEKNGEVSISLDLAEGNPKENDGLAAIDIILKAIYAVGENKMHVSVNQRHYLGKEASDCIRFQ